MSKKTKNLNPVSILPLQLIAVVSLSLAIIGTIQIFFQTVKLSVNLAIDGLDNLKSYVIFENHTNEIIGNEINNE